MLFTNYDIIWFQIQEMLRIEKGGREQVIDELEAYKDLIREFRSFSRSFKNIRQNFIPILQQRAANWLGA